MTSNLTPGFSGLTFVLAPNRGQWRFTGHTLFFLFNFGDQPAPWAVDDSLRLGGEYVAGPSFARSAGAYLAAGDRGNAGRMLACAQRLRRCVRTVIWPLASKFSGEHRAVRRDFGPRMKRVRVASRSFAVECPSKGHSGGGNAVAEAIGEQPQIVTPVRFQGYQNWSDVHGPLGDTLSKLLRITVRRSNSSKMQTALQTHRAITRGQTIFIPI